MRDCTVLTRRNGEMCSGIGVTWGGGVQGGHIPPPQYYFYLRMVCFAAELKRDN
jgi:hypothetical protein